MLMCAYAEVNLSNSRRRHSYVEIDMENPGVVAPVTHRQPSTGKTRSQNSRLRMSIADVLRNLKDSGWYWGEVSKEEAHVMLENTALGTFLLRDSTDACHLFTLCVRTMTGVQNIRVIFSRGNFKLDSVFPDLSAFHSVVGLVEYYLDGSNKEFCITTDDNEEETVVLRCPLWHEVPSLQHLCRQSLLRRVHYDPGMAASLPLPEVLKGYLLDYCPPV